MSIKSNKLKDKENNDIFARVRRIKILLELLEKKICLMSNTHLDAQVHIVHTELFELMDACESLKGCISSDFSVIAEYSKILKEKVDGITDVEITICMMVYHGKCSAEIANILSLARKTVENIRYRVTKKLKEQGIINGTMQVETDQKILKRALSDMLNSNNIKIE